MYYSDTNLLNILTGFDQLRPSSEVESITAFFKKIIINKIKMFLKKEKLTKNVFLKTKIL